MITEKSFLVSLKEMLGTSAEISMDTDLLDIEEWDSLCMMNFIVMCEDSFGISIDKHIIAEAVLVEDLYDALNQ